MVIVVPSCGAGDSSTLCRESLGGRGRASRGWQTASPARRSTGTAARRRASADHRSPRGTRRRRRRTRDRAAEQHLGASSPARDVAIAPPRRVLAGRVGLRPAAHRRRVGASPRDVIRRPRDAGTGRYACSRRSHRRPAAATSAGDVAVRWQPPATRRWSRVEPALPPATRGSGARPCSRTCRPAGRSTRRTSRGPPTSGIVHRVNVDSAASYDASRVSRSPSRPTRSTGTADARPASRRQLPARSEGSTASGDHRR